MTECPAQIEFKRNFRDTVARHRLLRRAERGCLVYTYLRDHVRLAEALAPMPALENIDFDDDPLLIPRLCCERIAKLWAPRADYPDDSLPYVSPRYGSGIVGAMLLGRVTFGSNTSWFDPVGEDLGAALGFAWGEENRWIDRVVDGLNYCARVMDGRCYTFLEGYHSPLEFAAMVRGSDLYLDLYTDPAGAHHLLQRCDRALMWLYGLLEERAPRTGYGVLAQSLWMERGLPFLSDDAAGLVSPEMYREFGLPYADAMFQRYGGGFLHVHTQSYHQMDNLSAMRNLTVYNWRQDPNTPQPHEVLHTIAKGAKHKIVAIVLTPRQIRQEIETLSRGRFIISTECRDRAEQEDIVEFVRRCAPIENEAGNGVQPESGRDPACGWSG